MNQGLIHYQIEIQIAFFIGTFALLAIWETYCTWRPWLIERKLRWCRHLGLFLLARVSLKFLFPLLALGAAISVEQRGIGVLYRFPLPFYLHVFLGLISMDLVMYLGHRMMHKFKWLWWLHRVHHMDKELDVSTGIRFHPLEELVAMAIRILGISFFGVPALAVFIFEIVLNMAALYTHANVRLTPRVEKFLRRFIVTPNMHRIHHSDTPFETNSNYGFCLSVWDKLFGTYIKFPRTTQRRLVVGLEEYRAPKYQTFENMLLLPFNLAHLKVRPQKSKKLALKCEDENLPHQYSENLQAKN